MPLSPLCHRLGPCGSTAPAKAFKYQVSKPMRFECHRRCRAFFDAVPINFLNNPFYNFDCSTSSTHTHEVCMRSYSPRGLNHATTNYSRLPPPFTVPYPHRTRTAPANDTQQHPDEGKISNDAGSPRHSQ